MRNFNIGEFQVMKMVKRSLVDIGYPDNIEVISYVGDNDSISYYATYQSESINERHIKPLRVKDIFELVNYAMAREGNETLNLNVGVKEGSIFYYVKDAMDTYHNKGRSKRRK